MMMGNYYTPIDDTVYSLTLVAPPDDFLFYQEDAKKILLEMSFDVLQLQKYTRIYGHPTT